MAAMLDEEFSTPWSRRIQKVVAKMTAEELAEFPDLKLTDKVHTLIFNAHRELVVTPDLSLADAISACGRRLRGIRLGLATRHDLISTFAIGFHQTIQKVHGVDGIDGWPLWDEKQPFEVHVGNMLMMELQGMYLLSHNAEEATLLNEQLESALGVWRNEGYRIQVMARLQEIGVVDFNPDDLHSRLLTLVSDYYLKHSAGEPLVERGISLLEEIVVFDEEAFASAERLANIKVKQGNPRGAYEIAHKAMEVAIASGFQVYASRLGVCTAVTIMAGAHGPGYSRAQVSPFLKAARRRLDACKFWLPPAKYERYSGWLRIYETSFNIVPGSNPNPGETSARANQMAATTIHPPQSMIRHCAGCKEPSLEMKKCSGCREVYYCSTKCQKENWSSHKEVCKQKQAERKK